MESRIRSCRKNDTPGYSDIAAHFASRSIHHRGTPEIPGLVLALDRCGHAHCDGVALRVDEEQTADVLQYLRQRELVSYAYTEEILTVESEAGELESIAFVVDPRHSQYCGGLSLREQAEIIASASGGRGSNREYLTRTAKIFSELGIVDENVSRLCELVRQFDRG